MTDVICDYRGEQDTEFRSAIYAGTIFRLPPSDASLRLVRHAWDAALETFGADPRHVGAPEFGSTPRAADRSSDKRSTINDDNAFFRQVGRLRHHLYGSEECRRGMAALLQQVGAIAQEHVVDPVRSRLISVNGHLNEAAASVYYAHRDTWYANPPAQVTWWLPLHDVAADHTFEFLPDCFANSVLNDSEVFDYDRWIGKGPELKIGCQDPKAGLRERYPRLLESLPKQRRVGFDARAGEVIVFSGQHLHQTRPIEFGLARLSVDFRTIHVKDYRRGLGPVNVDNRSTGDAFAGHQPLAVEKEA
ncbi:MAG: hypothetical protein ACR2NZ_19485 [Rubripirellula sp.]